MFGKDGVSQKPGSIASPGGERVLPEELGGLAAKVKELKIAITAGSATTEIDTTKDLPAKALVLDVLVEVTTAEATGGTKTINVGLLSSESGGDADGFVAGISVASTGVKRAGPAYHAGNDYPTSNTRGALLSDFTAGSAADDRGLYREKPHLSDSVTSKSVSWTRGSAFTEFAGYLRVLYVELE